MYEHIIAYFCECYANAQTPVTRAYWNERVNQYVALAWMAEQEG